LPENRSGSQENYCNTFLHTEEPAFGPPKELYLSNHNPVSLGRDISAGGTQNLHSGKMPQGEGISLAEHFYATGFVSTSKVGLI
jgi:hypothetical protein